MGIVKPIVQLVELRETVRLREIDDGHEFPVNGERGRKGDLGSQVGQFRDGGVDEVHVVQRCGTGEFLDECSVAGNKLARVRRWMLRSSRNHGLEELTYLWSGIHDEDAAAVVGGLVGIARIRGGGRKEAIAEHAEVDVVQQRSRGSKAQAAKALTTRHVRGDKLQGKAIRTGVVDVDGARMDEVIVGEVGPSGEFEYDETGLGSLGWWGLQVLEEIQGEDTLLGLAAADDAEVEAGGGERTADKGAVKAAGVETVVHVAGAKGGGEGTTLPGGGDLKLAGAVVRTQKKRVRQGQVKESGDGHKAESGKRQREKKGAGRRGRAVRQARLGARLFAGAGQRLGIREQCRGGWGAMRFVDGRRRRPCGVLGRGLCRRFLANRHALGGRTPCSWES